KPAHAPSDDSEGAGLPDLENLLREVEVPQALWCPRGGGAVSAEHDPFGGQAACCDRHCRVSWCIVERRSNPVIGSQNRSGQEQILRGVPAGITSRRDGP